MNGRMGLPDQNSFGSNESHSEVASNRDSQGEEEEYQEQLNQDQFLRGIEDVIAEDFNQGLSAPN